jgi:hypothetical protein
MTAMVLTGEAGLGLPGRGGGHRVEQAVPGMEPGWWEVESGFPWPPTPTPALGTHHPHLGEIDQAVLRVIRRPFFDEGQVGEVHPQVRDTGRVTTWKQMVFTIFVFHLKKRTFAKNRTPTCRLG